MHFLNFPPFSVKLLTTSHSGSALSEKAVSVSLAVLLIAGTAHGLFAFSPESTLGAHSQCSDGKDNDGDGKMDYPQDDDCQSLDDDFEGKGTSGNFITVTDGKETVQPGGHVIYIVTLKQQRDDQRIVNVDLHLPHQSNVVSASDGGSVATDHIRWTNVSVYRNVTRTLQVHANIDPGARQGQYLVARALVEGSEATDTTLVENYVAQSSNIYTVSVTDGKESVQPGENLTYTVRVRNTSGENGTTDVRLGLPYDTYFLSNSDGGRRDSYTVTWPRVTLAAGEERSFTATVQVDPQAHDRGAIRARAFAGSQSDSDQTIVKVGLPYNSITTSISDGRQTAEHGQVLTYKVTVKNNDPEIIASNIAVDAGLPLYAEFVSATEGGYYDGTNVRWLVTQIAPRDMRTLSFSIRVRSDAPMGSILNASSVADGITGSTSRDSTKVVEESTEVGETTGSMLFRKTSDRSEAFPGGSIRYTLSVRNTLSHTISDAVIHDRYDGRYLSLESYDKPGNLVNQSDGNMEWRVPVLQPGETWQTSYVLSVSPDTPAGADLTNVATIRGSDVSSVSLSEKVHTVTAGVMSDFPTTGAGMEGILATALATLSMTGAFIQKRKMLAV